jgi:hypothetical protein
MVLTPVTFKPQKIITPEAIRDNQIINSREERKHKNIASLLA